MSIGRAMQKARLASNETQEEVGKRTFRTGSAISKIESGTRSVVNEDLPLFSQTFDEPAVYFAASEQATCGVTLPHLNGKRIERSLSAMKELAIKEAQEALDRLNEMKFYKPAQYWDVGELTAAESTMFEALDAAASFQNLVALACEKYGMSQREIYAKWRMKIKDKGWME